MTLIMAVNSQLITITTTTTKTTSATITDDNYENICQYKTTSHQKACNMSKSKYHIY